MALVMLLFILRRNIYCSAMSFLNNNQPLYYLHPAIGQPSSIPCTLLHFICIRPLFPFLPLCCTLVIYFNCCPPGSAAAWAAGVLTGTSDMVTEMFLGWTVSCTHCRRSEAKRCGSSARSHRSLREHLRGVDETRR